MPYSVEIGNPIKVYDVVVRRKAGSADRRLVDLVRSDLKDQLRLCYLYPNRLGGWDVVACGDYITGPRLVGGFATMRNAFEYAIQIRPDINRRGKAARGEI